jgi:DNA mismatch endonuclease (patch repair protein)
MAGPAASSPAVAAFMSRQRRRDTAPELALRRALHALGLRYRVHLAGLPGRPDVVLTRARVAVFVDGCFWHRCPEHGVPPRSNAEWWRDKLARNVERDREVDHQLQRLGWEVVRVWEHEQPGQAAERVAALWRERVAAIAHARWSRSVDAAHTVEG